MREEDEEEGGKIDSNSRRIHFVGEERERNNDNIDKISSNLDVTLPYFIR